MEYTERRLTGSAAQVLENLPPPLAKLLMDELYRTQVKSVPMFNGMQVPTALRIFILVDALCPSAKCLNLSILV